ncbi:helix-turn-helix domain-containing protein [Conexibacter sp. SYSU D00693]|uniref:winged helix-turn-helix transcriptional regulator n=1 Tax=Conexibacter sp. SYSU D00693 TaxID=2812560 RepID=UPI00196B9979|nr:helix-turn-helix domain-containing protein [Conexibacter sp. SYSU D00693]
MPTQTAAQRRADAARAYDAFLAQCPTRQLLDRLADKWVALVLAALREHHEPMRFSQLARKIASISQKMLTQTLRALERDGLVTRTVTPTVPVRVDYELTPLGRDLTAVMVQLKTWAEAHMDEVQAARAAYDETAERAVAA